MSTHDESKTPSAPDPVDSRRVARMDEALRRIAESLQGLKFGSVLVVVQDGVVVQIERTEKTRIGR